MWPPPKVFMSGKSHQILIASIEAILFRIRPAYLDMNANNVYQALRCTSSKKAPYEYMCPKCYS